MFEIAPLAAFHAATPFCGGHIVVSRQVGVLLPITAYGAQQQVGEKTADEDGTSSAENTTPATTISVATTSSSATTLSTVAAAHCSSSKRLGYRVNLEPVVT